MCAKAFGLTAYYDSVISNLFDNQVKPGVIDISEAAGMQWGPDITKTFGNSEGV